MKINIQPIIIVALALVLLFSAERCSFNQKRAAANYTALTDTVTYYSNRLGTNTASIKAIQLNESQLKQIIFSKDNELATLAKHFSEVKTVVKYVQTVKLDTINVVFKDTVPCVFSRKGALDTAWYSLKYESNNKGFSIDSLTIPSQTTIITGLKQKWFLGRQTLTTDITNANPNIRITGIQSVQVNVPVPWYKKWYVWLGAGAAGGFLISK